MNIILRIYYSSDFDCYSKLISMPTLYKVNVFSRGKGSNESILILA